MSTDVDMSAVEWIRTLRVELLRKTPEVDTSPRGWGEAAITYSDVEKDTIDGKECILMKISGATYVFKPEVIEAIYDYHQDIPRS